MSISRLKRENDIATKNLRPQYREALEKVLGNISNYTVNNLDYEKAKADLIGLFQEAQIRGDNPSILFSDPEEMEMLCNELSVTYKSQCFAEKIINTLPVASLSSLLYCFASLVLFNSMPSSYSITPFDLVFWFVVAPFISVFYRHFSSNIQSKYIKTSFVIGNICIISIICCISTYFEVKICKINSYILMTIFAVIYIVSYIIYIKYYNKYENE